MKNCPGSGQGCNSLEFVRSYKETFQATQRNLVEGSTVHSSRAHDVTSWAISEDPSNKADLNLSKGPPRGEEPTSNYDQLW